MAANPLVDIEPVCFVAYDYAQVQADVTSRAAMASQGQLMFSVRQAMLDVRANLSFIGTDNAVGPMHGVVDLWLVIGVETHAQEYNVRPSGNGRCDVVAHRASRGAYRRDMLTEL